MEWYAKEVGLPSVEVVEVDFHAKAQKDAAFLEVSPFGRLPALRHGEVKLFETGAILLYLGETAGDPRLATPAGRAEQAAWVLAANSTVHEALFFGVGGNRDEPKDQALSGVLGTLDATLAARAGWLGGAEPFLSAADAAMASMLIYAASVLPAGTIDAARFPALAAWMDKVAARPAFRECFGPVVAALEAKRGV